MRLKRTARPDERAGGSSSVTTPDILAIFPGARVLTGADRLAGMTCRYCTGNRLLPPSMRGGKIISVQWPDGARLQCSYCGRAVAEMG